MPTTQTLIPNMSSRSLIVASLDGPSVINAYSRVLFHSREWRSAADCGEYREVAGAIEPPVRRRSLSRWSDDHRRGHCEYYECHRYPDQPRPRTLNKQADKCSNQQRRGNQLRDKAISLRCHHRVHSPHWVKVRNVLLVAFQHLAGLGVDKMNSSASSACHRFVNLAICRVIGSDPALHLQTSSWATVDEANSHLPVIWEAAPLLPCWFRPINCLLEPPLRATRRADRGEYRQAAGVVAEVLNEKQKEKRPPRRP